MTQIVGIFDLLKNTLEKDEISPLFMRKNCIDKFFELLDQIIDLKIDMIHLQWWSHFDINTKFDFLKWSYETVLRKDFYELIHYDINIYYYTRYWYRNPSLLKSILENNFDN